MNTTHDDNAERITLRSHEGARHSEPLITDDESDFGHSNDQLQQLQQRHDDQLDDSESYTNNNDDHGSNNNDEQQQQQQQPLLRRTYSQESGISTDSAPPPYEFYPPAKTFLGRALNWIRAIPRLPRRHQAIALPLHQRFYSHHHSDSLSSTSIDSFASSAYPATCCSYYYHVCLGRLPRATLPVWLARCRWVLICISIFAILLFAFLLFCSIFFAPASLSPALLPDLQTNTSARFLTLNIFMRPPGVTNNWSDYKEERLDYIVRYILPQYDVVAFQEAFAFGTRRKDQLIQRGRNMGYNHHVESPRHYPWDLGVDGGLLIMSRFPIRTFNTMEYPRGIHSDWLAYKGALHALIELNPTQSIHLYTTHAQASYSQLSHQVDMQVRMSQFAQFHQFIKETSQRDNNIPMLLLGDFNVDAAVHDGSITEPSRSSSVEYQLMMGVLDGKGIEREKLYSANIINEEKKDASHQKRQNGGKRLLYQDMYQLVLSDKVYEHYGYHPVTFGDIILNKNGEIEPAETILTDPEQVMTVQSIDRILWEQDRGKASSMFIRDAQVEKFLVQSNDMMNEHDKLQSPFTQISDHYGLSCVVQLS